MKLYFAPRTRAVRVAGVLEELDQPYELERFELGDPAMRTPEFRAIHPMGRVPVLEDGETRLFESGAIVEYLLERTAGHTLRPSPDSSHFADYLQWFHYCEGMIMPQINILTVETILLPPERRTEVNVKRATKLLGQMLAPVNDHMSDREYLAGEFSGADIMTGSAVISAKGVGIDFAALPNLEPYIERLTRRAAYQRAISL